MDAWASALAVGIFTAIVAYLAGKKDLSISSAATIWGLGILLSIVFTGGVFLKKPQDAIFDGMRELVGTYGFLGFVGAVIGGLLGYLFGEREANQST
jgi:amino acid transporter